jgi:acyl phosphate:glycerol-3-phosphate acyltransferase
VLTPLLITLVVGYLLGSIPVGYLIARSRGVDIFAVGSGNPGATNVRRTLGAGPGNLCYALDALKGALATGWLPALSALKVASGGECPLGGTTDPAAVGGLIGALLGHSFSCFTRFRGGKGVATASGGLLVLMPVPTLVAAALWAVTFYASRYVSLASLVSALVLPLAAWWRGHDASVLGVAGLIAVFVVVRHRSNISRLLAGTENRFGQSGAEPRDRSPS